MVVAVVVAETLAAAEGEAGPPGAVAVSSVKAPPADGLVPSGLSHASGAAAGGGVTEEVGRCLLSSRSGGRDSPLALSRPS